MGHVLTKINEISVTRSDDDNDYQVRRVVVGQKLRSTNSTFFLSIEYATVSKRATPAAIRHTEFLAAVQFTRPSVMKNGGRQQTTTFSLAASVCVCGGSLGSLTGLQLRIGTVSLLEVLHN